MKLIYFFSILFILQRDLKVSKHFGLFNVQKLWLVTWVELYSALL